MTITSDHIRHVYRSKKLEGRFELHETNMEWCLGTFSIHKHQPAYRIGWGFDLAPESHLLRRWFELEDVGVKGWAVIFHSKDPDGEIFVGWVPEGRQADADRWIAFLNGEIHDRLVQSGQTPTNASPAAAAPDRPAEPGTLRYVGNFVELGYEHHANPPSIVAARGRRRRANKAEVLSYLRKAKPVTISPGINEDFFDPTKTVRGETTRTDGVYIWGDFLADYVDRYDVELPEEFERHMEDRGWRLPENLDVRALKKPW